MPDLFDPAPDSPEEDIYAMGDRAEGDPFQGFAKPPKPRAEAKPSVPVPGESVSERYKREARARLEAPWSIAPKKTRGRRAINTTKLVIQYVKNQGDEILATEESQAYKKNGDWHRRSSDRRMKMDVMSLRPSDKAVRGWQGAGVGERKSHFEGFLGQGGPEEARRWYSECWYVEFRHDGSVAKMEQWL